MPISAISQCFALCLAWMLSLDGAFSITVVPPKLMPLSRIAQLHKGERYHITCSISHGSPPLTLSWSKDGEAIESDGASDSSHSDIVVRKSDDFSTSLVVEKVQENHAGNYSCTVTNPAGRDTGTTTLHVLYAPAWLRSPTDVSVTFGRKISLHCEAHGSPKPVITWRKNTDFSAMNFEMIHPDGRVRISEDGQSLQISEAKKQDEGFYECQVSNGVGEQLKKTVRIEVQVPPTISPGASEIVIEKGKDITLQCNMSGDPPLTMSWERNGKQVETRPKLKILEFPTDSGVATSLILTAVDRAASGLYTCKAKNAYGETYRIINLDVVEHPGPPVDLKVTQSWSRSFQLTWTPTYSGNRPITAFIIYYWRTEGKSEPPADKTEVLRITTSQTIAVISELLPNTIYSAMMIAENEVGQSAPSQTISATTREEEPEWSPQEVTVVEKYATSILLKWKCPHNREWSAPLRGYYIGYRRKNSKTTFTYRTMEAEKCLTQQEYLLNGLQRASNYDIIVKAFNSVGIGPQSDQVVVQTTDGGPPRSPFVKLLNTGGVSCNLKIWPKENMKNQPTGYVLHIKAKDAELQKIYVPVLHSKNYSVGGLKPSTQYDIYVTAKNEFGESAPYSTLKIVTDRSDPSVEVTVEQNYDKVYFILPVVLSALTIIVLPIAACYCLQRSTSRQMQADSIEVADFIYNAATIARIDATMRRASATLSRQNAARMAAMQMPPRTGLIETTTVPQPDPPQQVIVEPAPTLPTSYSTLQNYGTASTAIESSPPEEQPEEKNKTPPLDDCGYDSVVEEMRTLLKEGVPRPKKAIPEDSSDESS